ncbi:hypothetical protein HNP55_001614 [Paucibacter oligotrophus]|uniref:Uncharacterized protein n=1 Tax=Roseateles oligotrophus TaxID=1769250 RepID=A0A840L8N8_9BURK|nr:hypothetical protein [Roseateles oligotrophus]MBB4843095.1 hypothetical protein [Roseateles oligotrophus]
MNSPAQTQAARRRFALVPGLLALCCAAAGLGLAAHHPLSSWGAVLAWLALAALAARFWLQAPLILLGFLPLLGLAPWSGWISFEEMDLLALAVAAGGYLAWGLHPLSRRKHLAVSRRGLLLTPGLGLLLLLWAGAMLLALQRGFADAGGFAFGWFQGYQEPMNSWRVLKSFFLALLLLPLWLEAAAREPRRLSQSLQWGMVLALLGIGLAALWERLAFPGLLNFSSDYRTTALFWEMHVGGAALDASLAMTAPFALLALLRARRAWQFLALMGLGLMAAYVAMSTFSRIVYLALPLSFALLLGLRARQARMPGHSQVSAPLASEQRLGLALWGLGFLGAAVLVFVGGGYRGLAALMGAALLSLGLPPALWQQLPAQRRMIWLLALAAAGLLLGLGAFLAQVVPKSAYVLYALVLLLNLALLVWHSQRPPFLDTLGATLVLGAWMCLLGCVVVVAGYWGGWVAGAMAGVAVLTLALLFLVMLQRPSLWPWTSQDRNSWRRRGLTLTALLIGAAGVAALDGGNYLLHRVGNSQADSQFRMQHWRQSLGLLGSAEDQLLGKGAGRFLAQQYFSGLNDSHVGDYRLRQEEGRNYLRLSAGQHMLGSGEMFRIWQRVDMPQGAVSLQLRLRTSQTLQLHIELCERHLIYPDNCLVQQREIPAGADWQPLQLELGNAPLKSGPAYAPRMVAFALAVATPLGQLDIAELGLRDGQGRSLLANGDFSQQMAHWFFSSDRFHMAWHAKNLAVHLLFEQGWLGLGLFGIALTLALWNLSLGAGRQHPLAPALAAALLGLLVVGAADSLLDAPRVGLMFYTLLLFALCLQAGPEREASSPQSKEA